METNEAPGQAPQQPVEERVASLFLGKEPEQPPEVEAPEAQAEPETEASADEPQEAQAPEDFEYEYEGAKFKLPKPLEKALMQQKDYTQKTQELAEQRRMVEAKDHQIRLATMEQTFSQEVANERQQIAMFDAALASAKDTNWGSMSTDEAFRTKLQLDQWKEQREALDKTIQARRGEFDNKVRAEISKYREQAVETLKKSIPNWSDDVAKQVRDHALQEGYTEAELGSLFDPRWARSLWKAAQYDQIKGKASEAVNTAKAQPVKPSPSRPMDAKTKDYLNYRKTLQKAPPGSQERKAAVQDRIAKIFGG